MNPYEPKPKKQTLYGNSIKNEVRTNQHKHCLGNYYYYYWYYYYWYYYYYYYY